MPIGENFMVTFDDIRAFLEANGIKNDDTVLVHTSMRALGEVEGGCDGLIDAFKSYLSEGLFVVPTHTWANVGAENPVYDVKSTVPCIGALPTVAAFRSDGVRSLHPTHSVAAFGKRAAEFVSGEEKATSPAPVGGAWSRLYDEDAKILLLGVGLKRNTFIHAVDEMIDLEGRLGEPIPITVIGYEGERYELSFRKHGKTGSENFGLYEKAFDTLGVTRKARLGNADVIIVNARKCTEAVKRIWERASFDFLIENREIPEEYYL